ncbi:Hypothetical protein NCS54_01068500 [Fusarium falciforme]|uniref:Hypothetical protein n=1 Tax=Fusarium falciforme TaxID=195108 RepID=UPI0023013AD1|nr:Hypothetical protein NCS54_01068500 [Fusarium falciforme]WAO93151.1 Hypothetical protein NCS54_01068500 [Fusarium falciforme]
MTSLPPPAYEEVVTRRVDEHYLTCTRPTNEGALKSHMKHRVGTFSVRGWIASNGGTTVAVGHWWMDGGKRKTWEACKPIEDHIAKPTQDRSTKEKLVQWLRTLRSQRIEQEAASIFAVNGTPIQPGEVEYTILSPTDTTGSGEYDWTEKWGWKVKLRAYTYAKHVGCSRWTITCRMFLDDLPSLLQAGGISWKDDMVDIDDDRFDEDSFPNRRWNWVRSYLCWPSSASGRKWKASVDERHREQSSLERDFRYRLSTGTVYRAQISQRTGPRKYKTVMIYDLDTVYANDISGERVEVWHDGLAERFAQFIRPLVP